MKGKKTIKIIIVIYVATLLYASIIKLSDYSVFVKEVSEVSILAPISGIVSILLPLIEAAIATMLMTSKLRLLGLRLSLFLMILFSVYIIYVYTKSDNLPCGCGGIIELLTWKQHLIFNGSLIALSIYGIVIQKKLNRLFRENLEIRFGKNT